MLTERQEELLRALIQVTRLGDWVTPMFVGGFNGSWHHSILSQLVKKGLVDRYRWGGHGVRSYAPMGTHNAGGARERLLR